MSLLATTVIIRELVDARAITPVASLSTVSFLFALIGTMLVFARTASCSVQTAGIIVYAIFQMMWFCVVFISEFFKRYASWTWLVYVTLLTLIQVIFVGGGPTNC